MNNYLIYLLYGLAIIGIAWNGFLCGIALKEIADRNELRQVMLKRGGFIAVLATLIAIRIFA